MNEPVQEGPNQGEWSRRAALRRSGQVAAGVGAVFLGAELADPAEAAAAPDRAAAPDTPASPPGHGGTVRVTESSNLRVHVSRDGSRLVIDALNSIWTLPAGGGAGHRLTGDLQDATQPHFSPDGRSIVFQSFRDGVYDLWLMGADGSGERRLTDGPGYDLEPAFSPEGTLIAFASDRGNASHIWLLDPATGVLRRLTDGEHKHAQPSFSPDGKRVLYVLDDVTVAAVSVSGGTPEKLVTAEADTVFGPVLSPSGKRLAYVTVTGPNSALVVDGHPVADGEDVAPFAPNWLSERELLYSADGVIRRRVLTGGTRAVAFSVTVPIARRAYRRHRTDLGAHAPQTVQGIAGPVLSPDGTHIAFRALNALWLMRIGAEPKRIVSDGYFNTDPDFAPDGRSLVYVSDRAGTANLWRYDIAAGRSTRLTDLPNAQLTPRFSPDGSRIAYQDESGATWVLTLAGATVRQVLPAMYQPGRPTFSPDGGTIAIAAVKPYSRRTTSGHNQVLTVELASGTVRYQEIAPERSIATRGDDGPVWTRDGRYLVAVSESLAWRIPVNAAGTVSGPPVALTDEVTDSVSVSGDSRTVLYLSNGRLRLVDVAGGPARTVPLSLGWRPRRVHERVVVRLGALWDGRATSLRRNVDLVLDGDRIADIVPRGRHRGGRLIDASGLTAMPGLIDTHNHWHLRGRQWGDRQGRAWLAYGVTTSRSPGDPAYQMVETREALSAGDRVGPRYLGTGEPLDGTRAYYNFMRPVFDGAQLERELQRAVALRYNVLKSYMRLPLFLERRAVAVAHANGMPVTSHYLYPAAITGLDGMEHTGGGNRLGYSRTLSYAGGRTSSDSVALLAASGMWISTTTLFANEMFVGDHSLIDDERTRVLFPPWEYQRLVQKAEDATKPSNELNRAWTAGDVDMLLRVHRAGGLVVTGTDSALDDVAVSMHQNLRAMVKHGFTPHEALVCATGNAARCLGLADQIGAIAPGMLADLAFVRGNPLRDIRDAARVELVMVGGARFTIPELLAPFRTQQTGEQTGEHEQAGTSTEPAAASAAVRDEHYWHAPEWATHGCCRAR